MKIEHIINETTTAGAVSSVAMPLGKSVKRTNETVKGLIPAEKVMKAKKKGPYANSLSEGKNRVSEAELQEDDLIIIPGQGMKRKNGFIPQGKSRVDHEVEMAKSDLLAIFKNTKSVMNCIKDKTEDEGLEGWVQEKIIKASDYMNTIAEYLEGKRLKEMSGGVIAAGGVGESAVEEGDLHSDFDDVVQKVKRDWEAKRARERQGMIPRTVSEPSREELEARLRELESKFDPEYQYSDDYSFWTKQNAIAREIASIKKKLGSQGVAEGFSDVVKGINRRIKGKEHPEVVASKHAGRAIGHYNQGDIAAGDKETKRYVKTRDMHLKAKGVAESKSLKKKVVENKLHVKKITSEKSLIEHSKLFAKNLTLDGVPITSKNRYPVVCSTIFAMNKNSLNESAHITNGKQLVQSLKKMDQFSNLPIRIGSSVAIINAQLQGDSVELWGFTTPKTITKIYRDSSDKSIKQFEFNNDPNDVWPRTENAEYNGQFLMYSAFFGDKKSADQALTMLVLQGSGDLDIRNHITDANLKEDNLTEKAKSTAQQKFFGMAHAMQKGKKIPGASKELKDVAKSMSKSDVKDFAKTKHKDLPDHVKKEK